MLSPPVIDGTFESGSTYFREPLDIIIGFVDEDGDFLNYHADARRFEPYSGPGSKAPPDAAPGCDPRSEMKSGIQPEWAPHRASWMAWPRPAIWGRRTNAVRAEIDGVDRTICASAPVHLL